MGVVVLRETSEIPCCVGVMGIDEFVDMQDHDKGQCLAAEYFKKLMNG